MSERLVTKYGIKIPKETAISIFMGQPKVPVFLSRASFRSDVDVRTEQRTQFQQGRRQFLHAMLGVVGVSVIGLMLLKTSTAAFNPQITSASNPQVASTSNPQPQASTPASNAASNSGQLLANASNIPLGQSLTFNDPAVGPVLLIHLDNGQFVAYSSICTHAGCQVQFDPSSNDIVCPCHGAVYDPANNAQVLAGPAPYPLQKIPIQYDHSTGNIYLAG
jgi:thiosulfate dehydrogenase [quinone] large subunit